MADRAATSLSRLLGRFHFGITLLAVAMSGLTVFLAGIAALRGYAESNLELASQLGAYSVEPALVFNDPVAAREAIAPLTRLPGIARVTVLDANGRSLAEWRRQSGDPAPLVTNLFFPAPLDTRIMRNGTAVGQIRLWGDSAALSNYARAGLIGGLACLVITALGTIFIARRFSRTISGHIAAIAEVAHDVRLHRRFDRRVEPLPVAELNRLGKDVNALFDELAGWHRSLEAENAKLSRRALQDPLTGLPNRAAFDAHVAERMAVAGSDNFALLYLDLDRFKATNDQLGHAAGDSVLRAIGQRLAAVLHDGDMAARLGGDEFVVVTAPGRGGAVAEQLARTITQAVAAPVDIGAGVSIMPSASIGIGHYPRDGRSVAALLGHADSEMYRIKQSKADQRRR
jgi:diguanylate cyclase (GGDEF)-like protein